MKEKQKWMPGSAYEKGLPYNLVEQWIDEKGNYNPKKLHYSHFYEKERFWMLSYLLLSLAMLSCGLWLLVFNQLKGILLIVFCTIPFGLFLSEYQLVKEIKKNKYVKEYMKNPDGVV